MNEPVVVLGMHRSGTSFLIRALNLSGLWLGQEPQLSSVEGRAKIGNPKGNYEHLAAIGINNAILFRSGGAWFRPPAHIVTDASDSPLIRSFCAHLQSGQPPEYRRWGWKDPRTLLTLDSWLRALQTPIFVVASFRHPAAVARSLLTRDNIPLEVGYALWVHYNLRLLECLQFLPHVLIRFDVDKQELLERTVGVCALTGLETDRNSLDRWHDPQLIRSSAPREAAPLDAAVSRVWEQLTARYDRQSTS